MEVDMVRNRLVRDIPGGRGSARTEASKARERKGRCMRKNLVTNALLALVAVAMIAQPMMAGATHQPADKVVASGEAIEEVAGPAEPIMSTTFKASRPTDLMVHVTLECSILTRLHNEGGPEVDQSTGSAAGRIRVWLKLNGKQVAISQISSNPQPNDPPEIGRDIDKVTFCNNEQEFTVTDTEQDEDGSCDEQPEPCPADGTDTYDQYLKTKTANAFNWIVLNTGGWGGTNNGIHELEVWAEFDAYNVSEGSEAAGFIGNRMLIVEPTKMSNHALV